MNPWDEEDGGVGATDVAFAVVALVGVILMIYGAWSIFRLCLEWFQAWTA